MDQKSTNSCCAPEKIRCAAVKYPGGIAKGLNHADCLFIIGEIRGHGADRCNDIQGFVTTTGRFVNRMEAYIIAEREGQLTGTPPGRKGILYSEFCKYEEMPTDGISQKE